MLINNPDLWRELVTDKKSNRHKYDYGHVAVLGGEEMTGAASLAAISALRMGAGLVTILSPPKVVQVYRRFCPSLIVKEFEGLQNFSTPLTGKQNAVVIGPGVGLNDQAGLKHAVLDVLTFQKRTILDADALNVFAGDVETLCGALHDKCILTPHEGEFARLFPDIIGEKSNRAMTAAKRAGCIVLLKGHETFVAHPDGRVVLNDNGTAWLASAGTGDVLAGMIAGLAAWKDIPLFKAVCAATWFHGRAAQIFGPGLISEDLPDILPQVWQEILT